MINKDIVHNVFTMYNPQRIPTTPQCTNNILPFKNCTNYVLLLSCLFPKKDTPTPLFSICCLMRLMN